MQDQVIKEGKWEFDKEVTDCFSNMLSRSIPDYDNMRKLAFKIGKRFIKDGSNIIDIGCSTGESIKDMAYYGAERKIKIYGLEVSKPMIEAARERLKPFKFIEILECDITKEIVDVPADLICSILTIQFTPIEERQQIFKKIYDQLNKGGAFILVEKVIGESAQFDTILTDVYYEMKKLNGYTKEQIQSKRKALSGVLVPVTAKWNEDLLKTAGFTHIECFWRHCNFAGWVAVK